MWSTVSPLALRGATRILTSPAGAGLARRGVILGRGAGASGAALRVRLSSKSSPQRSPLGFDLTLDTPVSCSRGVMIMGRKNAVGETYYSHPCVPYYALHS